MRDVNDVPDDGLLASADSPAPVPDALEDHASGGGAVAATEPAMLSKVEISRKILKFFNPRHQHERVESFSDIVSDYAWVFDLPTDESPQTADDRVFA
jgi:hypothetical protein